MRRRCGFALLIALFVGLMSRALWAEERTVPEARTDVSVAVRGNTAFALDLYAKLRTGEGNLFFSPMSISTALGMTYAGARGETAREMSAVLHLAADRKEADAALGSLVRQLNALGTSGKFQLSVANGLWLQKGYPFIPEYVGSVSKNYDAAVEELNFAESEPARRIINDWVEKKTKDRIKDLIPPGVLTELTRLVLTNAIYFKGDWVEPFKEALTKDQPFSVAPDTKVNVPLMRQTKGFGYLHGEGFQALEMPYAGDVLSMVVLLPDQVDGLAALEQSLTAENLDGWLKAIRRQRVLVFLPRFKMTVQFQLAPTLAGMGMPLAFDLEKADFSGMTTAERVFISHVIHKAFVEVNEKGTEAAAATAVVAAGGAAPVQPPTFRADHPFVFLIRDKKTGSILFIGRVVNPKT